MENEQKLFEAIDNLQFADDEIVQVEGDLRDVKSRVARAFQQADNLANAETVEEKQEEFDTIVSDIEDADQELQQVEEVVEDIRRQLSVVFGEIEQWKESSELSDLR
ncbi:hypothetical protein [Candidatus Nanohalobium constans]|uniref:Uncharacterized protein n=1 Tax=Candidatus Nanohalobium constans TaxID=2565781 RepID=A0A5Q0UED3_9ARCH|nr:hypothetical protein [Candidatus Nanohalobium constans]QGA79922.1 hypothetical protein LC1Nh_0013 [Candidatus Nanohalobium constans]